MFCKKRKTLSSATSPECVKPVCGETTLLLLFFSLWLIHTLKINCSAPPWNDIDVVVSFASSRQLEHKRRTEGDGIRRSQGELKKTNVMGRRAPSKGLWVGFLLCAMAALCQGLLPGAPVPKHLKKNIQLNLDTTAAGQQILLLFFVYLHVCKYLFCL